MVNKTIAWVATMVAVFAAIAAAPTYAADASNVTERAAMWAKAANAGNLQGLVELYAEDGCRMPPNTKIVQGREALLAHFKSSIGQGTKTDIAVTTAESSGSMSYGTGTYVVTAADGKHLDHGKWMLVSKKVGGKWKTQCDIWNSDMPVPSEKAK